jgi:phage-related protein
MAGPIKISILADEKDAVRGFDRTEAAMKEAEDTAERTGRGIQSHLEGGAEGADTLASKGAQAAGALSGIGDVVGTKFPAVGAALTGAGAAMQFAADSGDLLNVAIEGGQKLWASTVGVLGKVGNALKLQKIATVAQTAAQGALNLVMSANPILLVVLAIAALVAAFVIAYKKSATFRAIVQKVGAALKAAAQFVAKNFVPALKSIVTWVKDHVVPVIKTMIKYFGPGLLIAAIKLVISWFKDHFMATVSNVARGVRDKVASITDRIGRIASKVKSVASGVRAGVNRVNSEIGNIYSKAKSVVSKVTGKFGDLVSWFRNSPGRIGRAARGMFDGIVSAFRSAINRVIGSWNRLRFTVPSISIPGIGSIGGMSFGVPQIPYLANGGIVTGPTLAVVGEAGPEAVVPLDGRFGGNTYKITVNPTPLATPADIGRAVVSAIREFEGASGRRVLA